MKKFINRKQKTKKNKVKRRIWNALGLILCILLIPILAINCTLLIKSRIHEDRVPDIGGVFPLIIMTDSMSPAFDSGDLIICHTAETEDVQVGDVIAFFVPGGNRMEIKIHRVTEMTEEKDGTPVWRTQSDAFGTEDEILVPYDDLVGEWESVRIPKVGNAAMVMQSIFKGILFSEATAED